MRWIRVALVSAAALGFSSLEGCGGKVVIDADGVGGAGASGGGFAGSGGAGGTTTSSTSSSSGNTCMEGTCSGTPDGSCDCAGTCAAGAQVKATCFSTSGSFTCACSVNGEVKAKCESPAGAFACDVKAGCCAPFFP